MKPFLKVILVGDAGVGKTSIINRYVNNGIFDEKATIGVDVLNKDIVVNNRQITMEIWDTAGQEKFSSLGVAFFRGAACCVLVYDVTSYHSFASLENWYNEVNMYSHSDKQKAFSFILLGNKVDLSERAVNVEHASDWCNTKNNMFYFETSATEDINVDQAFETVARQALDQDEAYEYGHKFSAPIHLDDSTDNALPTKSCSC